MSAPPPDAPRESAKETFPSEAAALLGQLGLRPEEAETSGAADGTVSQLPADQARSAAASSSPTSVQVPGYDLLGELGRGGMGVVYKATQLGLNRTVALKMVIAGPYADPVTRARFLVEAESVAALEHPHIVRVFAFGEHAGHPYLAMEHVPGGTLADRVKALGTLPPREAAGLVEKVAGAVAHAHARGVVHRDIKPGNVLLTADGDPRLTDFGLAKVGRSDLTGTNAILGTPAFMSPEQAAGRTREVGTHSDVYALGALLYDLLTGRPPFGGDSVAVTLQMVLTEDPDRPRAINQAIPRDLETVCLKCLEKEPARRYPSAQSLAEELQRFLKGELIQARPAGRVERASKWVRRNKGLAAAVATVTLSLLLGSALAVGFGVRSARDAERANAEALRADRKAEEANQLATRVKAALADSQRLAGELTAAATEIRQRAPLYYLAYGQLCSAAARVATSKDRGSAEGLARDFQGLAGWLSDGGDPAVRVATANFSDALAGWSSGPPPSILRQQSLRLARTCREAWLNKIEREYPDLAAQIRERLYCRVCTAATGLLATTDPAQVKRSKAEVWEFYWGELAIVETKEVEAVMVRLGKLLENWTDGRPAPDELKTVVRELHEACGRPDIASR